MNKIDLSNDSVNIILASWRSSTKKQYNVYITQWLKFCSDNSIDPDSANIESGTEFLTYLFKSNLGYSAINTARSELSTMIMDVNNVPFGQHVLVKRVMKGIFELRPALPKYSKTWNIQTVLDYLMGSSCTISLKLLSLRLTMLLCLLTAQCCQTIYALSTDFAARTKHIFVIDKVLKTTRLGVHIKLLEYWEFEDKWNICVVNNLNEHLERTRELRKGRSQLLISYVKPHAPVSKSTIARWYKVVLEKQE